MLLLNAIPGIQAAGAVPRTEHVTLSFHMGCAGKLSQWYRCSAGFESFQLSFFGPSTAGGSFRMAFGCCYFRETVYFILKNREGQGNFASSVCFLWREPCTYKPFMVNKLRDSRGCRYAPQRSTGIMQPCRNSINGGTQGIVDSFGVHTGALAAQQVHLDQAHGIHVRIAEPYRAGKHRFALK